MDEREGVEHSRIVPLLINEVEESSEPTHSYLLVHNPNMFITKFIQAFICSSYQLRKSVFNCCILSVSGLNEDNILIGCW